eukprot:TRINITY_DN2675_c0_g2_i1.p1 TRINITY_DN2675_c0_g2~~TRINITY_DN2675_c0_g2_i1.p1  ORF type:complete len:51 (-),score=1.61 TRINITY_DN2675_c0_g2_i1:49-201(-)
MKWESMICPTCASLRVFIICSGLFHHYTANKRVSLSLNVFILAQIDLEYI